jgi:lysophospholipid acyltransferase (LPLAT)-like uncharacterized protein
VKLRKPWMINLAAWLGAKFARGLMSTVSPRIESFGQHTDPWDPTVTERLIYLFWHENLFVLGKFRSASPIALLTSRSSDGELAARLVEQAGVRTVRGSSSNGAMDAIEELIEVGRSCHLCIAPDGPRGPRGVVKRGVVYLASWAQMRVVPLGIAFSRAWRARSWDQTAIPCPFSRMSVVGAPVIQVPQGLGKREMEAYRLRIEQSMATATDIAQDWVDGRIARPRWPVAAAAA